MKKLFILFITMFLLTGCAVKYSVIIDEDLTVIEEAKMTGTEEFFNNYYKTTRINVLKSVLEIYQDILETNNYQYELIKEQLPYVRVTKKYDNVKAFTENSILFNDYFDEINYTEHGDIKRIETVGFNDNDPDNPDRFDVKQLEIAIKCPYKVTNYNAKEVDYSTNTYYYELNEDNNKIIFEYDTSVKFSPKRSIVSTIIICIVAIAATWFIVISMEKNNNKVVKKK